MPTGAFKPILPIARADVWARSSYGVFTLQSVFTDWITLDITEAQARSGVSGGAAQDAGAKTSRISSAIVDGLNKLYAKAGNTGNLIVGPALPAPLNQIKWADLDKNGDGVIDYFTVVHSGYDASALGTSSDGM